MAKTRAASSLKLELDANPQSIFLPPFKPVYRKTLQEVNRNSDANWIPENFLKKIWWIEWTGCRWRDHTWQAAEFRLAALLLPIRL